MIHQITTQENLTQLSTLDFRNNNRLVLFSYLLRGIGAVGFSSIFYAAVSQIRPNENITFESLISIAIEGVPDIFSIVLIALAVIFVLWLHELVHASVFFLHTGASPSIGIRGPIIFASAEGYLNDRNMMIVNALAPFVVISTMGLLLMPLVPESVLAWIFIPTVVNAAAAGGDFIAVNWLLSLPKNAKIEDHGDILIAYEHTI